jgi:hypothetical protein
MRKAVGAGLISVALLASAAGAQTLFFPLWHVVQPRDGNACYRVTVLPGGEGWRDLGTFNTFRNAGRWEWGHRAICQVMN